MTFPADPSIMKVKPFVITVYTHIMTNVVMTIATIPYTFTTHHKTASNIESCSRLFQGNTTSKTCNTTSKTCLKCHAGFCCTDRSGIRRPLGSLVQSSQLPVDLPTKDVNIDLPQGDPKMRRFIPKNWTITEHWNIVKSAPKHVMLYWDLPKKMGQFSRNHGS